MKRVGSFLFGLLLVGLIALFCHRATDGFALRKTLSNLTYRPEWDIATLPKEDFEEVRAILKQSFSYLGKGQQSYAFVSEDGKYVLKLFRHDRISPPFWANFRPFPSALQDYRERKIKKREGLLARDFGSYKLAFEELKRESGLLFIHLNATENLKQTLTLYDKIGIRYFLDLDRMTFVLQKRAEPVFLVIDRFVREGALEKAKESMRSIVELILSRCQKGILDEDPAINKNLGLTGTEPLFIDVGRFKRDPAICQPEASRENLLLALRTFKAWLTANHPDLLPSLEEELARHE